MASVTFLGYRDAEVEASHALRLAIARVIREVRPEVMLTFDPQRYYGSTGINHPDHLAVGASMLAAVMPLANTLLAAPALAAEGLAPHDVGAVYLFDPAAPTNWMPLTDREVERKMMALRAHASQLAGWDGVACCTAAMRDAARAAGTAGVRCGLAEPFTAVRLAAPDLPAKQPRRTGERTQRPLQAGLAWLAQSMRQALARLSPGAAAR